MLFLILSTSPLKTPQGPLGHPENPLFSKNNHVTDDKQRGLHNRWISQKFGPLKTDIKNYKSATVTERKSYGHQMLKMGSEQNGEEERNKLA